MLNTSRSYLRLFARKFLQTLDRAKCRAFFFSPPLGKSLNIILKNEGVLLLVDTSFTPRDSPRPAKTKMVMSASSTSRVDGHYDNIPNNTNKYSRLDSILRAVFVGDIDIFFFFT